VEALLSLKGLFILMQRHNLEFPRFYAQLYALVSAEALAGPHRARFADELNLFLSSTGLPAYLTAAFAKKLARIALLAPPAACALCLALVYNLLQRFPPIRCLIHRPSSELGGSSRDPYRETEADPAASHALDSCLWEVDSLRSHYCPHVVTLAQLFASPLKPTTPPLELPPLASISPDALLALETGRKLRHAPLAGAQPPALLRPNAAAGMHCAAMPRPFGPWQEGA